MTGDNPGPVDVPHAPRHLQPLSTSRCPNFPPANRQTQLPSPRLSSSRLWIARPVLLSDRLLPATNCDDLPAQSEAALLQESQMPSPREESRFERFISASCPLYKIQSATVTSQTPVTGSRIHVAKSVSSISTIVSAYLADLDDKLRFFELPQAPSYVETSIHMPITIISMVMNVKSL
jgi:hypothetical protein